MAEKYLVIVESPTKAKTIRKYLPKNYLVEASMGHIRDLPQSATEIPAAVKGQDWAKLGVNVDADFEPLYVILKGKSKIVREIKKKLKECTTLYLATDEDREGESISWHLVQLLKPKVPVKRMVFHEITKKAILGALENTREIDMKLVSAQETRRVLDRIYGYTLSPLLWKKIAYGLSAGRVQSSGLRLISDREKERIRFRKSVYWDVKATLKNSEEKNFEARLTHFGGERVASGKDFDQLTGKLKIERKVKVIDEKEAGALADKLEGVDWKVENIQEKTSSSKPLPPFITSTLQQEGNRKLGMSAKVVMRTAQSLYEKGLITYMRTDSPNLSSEAIEAARKSVEELYGKEFLSPEPRQFKSKSKQAQEAHEAIRPAGTDFSKPDELDLDSQEKNVYELIWKRTLACQMAEAQKSSMSVKIIASDAEFTANGTKIVFPGFLRVYVEGKDDPESALENKEVILPNLVIGDILGKDKILPVSHETKPPARYTEASLVQRLEQEGIGRPSTYATIIGTVIDRGYVRKEGNALIPTFTGMAVIQLLETHFKSLIDFKFTSEMEDTLDGIATGEKESIAYLKKFYLGKKGLRERVKENDKKIKPDESRTIKLPGLKLPVDVKVGRYGPYIVSAGKGSAEIHASIPEEIAPSDLKLEDIEYPLEQSKNGPTPIGQDPENGDNIYCLTGRYGAYLQRKEVTEEIPKPKRVSLPKPWTPKTVELEFALKLLSLPRELGEHPEKKLPVTANLGRFGPYVGCDGDFRSLKKEDDVYLIDLARALELLAMEKKSRRGAALLKDFGPHPKKKRRLGVYNGKYGPFIKFGTKNISLPEDIKEKITKDESHAEKMTLKEIVKIVDEASKK